MMSRNMVKSNASSVQPNHAAHQASHWSFVGSFHHGISEEELSMVDMARSVGLPVAQKEIAGRLESGTQTGEHEKDESKWRAKNLSGEPKRDGSLPRDHACRRQQPYPAH